MRPNFLRGLRIFAVFTFAATLLYFSISKARPTEVSGAIPFALIPVGLILGFGAVAFEGANVPPVLRRDALIGLSTAVLGYATLRLLGAV